MYIGCLCRTSFYHDLRQKRKLGQCTEISLLALKTVGGLSRAHYMKDIPRDMWLELVPIPLLSTQFLITSITLSIAHVMPYPMAICEQ